MKPSLAVSVTLCLLGLAGSLRADEAVVSVGARVRFTAPLSGQRVDGTVLALDEHSLTLKLRDEQDPTVFARSSVEKLEVRRPGKRLKGALIGLLVGTALGTLAAQWAVDTGEAMRYSVRLGIPGAIAGALVAPGACWEHVPQGGVTVSVAPRPDRGFEARLTVRF
jgi:hypothetical protein